MPEPIANPVEVFLGAFPNSWLTSVARIVAEAYSSQSNYHLFPQPEMNDLWPTMRRARIEADLRHIADGQEGISARTETNTRNNSHTVVESGSVVFTQSHVHAPNEVVRPAVHREQRARGNRPYFPCMASEMEPLPRTDASLYAIVIHDAAPDDPGRLGFLDVVFPAPDGKSYLDERIHLIHLLGVGSTRDDSGEEQISDDLPIELRELENEEGV